jgi:CIC family chloride channel protein
MGREPATVLPTTPLRELTRLFLNTNRHAFPVVDERSRLVGIVSLTDLRKAEDADLDTKHVGDLMTRTLVTVSPEDSLDTALLRMGPKDLSRLPVVSRDDPERLLGVIRRNDLVRAYNLALTRRRHPAVDASASLRRAERVEFIEIDLPDDSPCLGKTVAEVSSDLPSESLLVSIRRRDGETVFPHGDTAFRTGDRVTAYARRGNRDALRRSLGAGASGEPARS